MNWETPDPMEDIDITCFWCFNQAFYKNIKTNEYYCESCFNNDYNKKEKDFKALEEFTDNELLEMSYELKGY